MDGTDEASIHASHHQVERFNHALYGLIIVTATLVAERLHVVEAGDALAILIGTGLVLFLAHTYASVLSIRAVEGHPLGSGGRMLVLLDNAPVVGAIVVPSALFVLSALDVMSLRTAYVISIVFSLGALIGLGVYQGWIASGHRGKAAASGAAAGGLGILVVLIEAFLD